MSANTSAVAVARSPRTSVVIRPETAAVAAVAVGLPRTRRMSGWSGRWRRGRQSLLGQHRTLRARSRHHAGDRGQRFARWRDCLLRWAPCGVRQWLCHRGPAQEQERGHSRHDGRLRCGCVPDRAIIRSIGLFSSDRSIRAASVSVKNRLHPDWRLQI